MPTGYLTHLCTQLGLFLWFRSKGLRPPVRTKSKSGIQCKASWRAAAETQRTTLSYFATFWLASDLTVMSVWERMEKVATLGSCRSRAFLRLTVRSRSQRSCSGRAWLAKKWAWMTHEFTDSTERLDVSSTIEISLQTSKMMTECSTPNGTSTMSTCGKEWAVNRFQTCSQPRAAVTSCHRYMLTRLIKKKRLKRRWERRLLE